MISRHENALVSQSLFDPQVHVRNSQRSLRGQEERKVYQGELRSKRYRAHYWGLTLSHSPLSVTVRLKTSFFSVESGSTQKYPLRSN
jgi:hypothetical protein